MAVSRCAKGETVAQAAQARTRGRALPHLLFTNLPTDLECLPPIEDQANPRLLNYQDARALGDRALHHWGRGGCRWDALPGDEP